MKEKTLLSEIRELRKTMRELVALLQIRMLEDYYDLDDDYPTVKDRDQEEWLCG